MAKNHTWQGNTLSQTLCGQTFTLDVGSLPANIVEAALKFAVPTLLRNATAGLANEDPEKAKERVAARIAAWLEGKWSAKGEASAEPRTSLLAKALAEVFFDGDVKAASAKIEELIESNLVSNNVDVESDDDEEKAKARTVANAVRKQIRDSAEVAPVYKRMSEEAKAKADASKERVSIAGLMG